MDPRQRDKQHLPLLLVTWLKKVMETLRTSQNTLGNSRQYPFRSKVPSEQLDIKTNNGVVHHVDEELFFVELARSCV
jgi:hypothetical protein